MHPTYLKVSTENVIHGTGLLATRPIQAGEILFQWDETCTMVSMDDFWAMPEAERDEFWWFAFQCDANTFIYSDDDDGYMNHCCDPNSWWRDDQTLVASRDIAAGEEVTYDYATTEISVPFSMPCKCGASNCRSVVTHRDHLDPAWQARFGDHLPTFVKQSIQKHQANRQNNND